MTNSHKRQVRKYVWPSKAKAIPLRTTAQREADHAYEDWCADFNHWRTAH